MKKIHNILLAVIIVLVITLVAVICAVCYTYNTPPAPAPSPTPTPTPSPAPTQEVLDTGWKDIYKDFLMSREYIYWAQFADLNFDGTPELLYSYTGASASQSLNIYQIIDGKIELRFGYDDFPESGNKYNLTENTEDHFTLPSYFPYEFPAHILLRNKQNGALSYVWLSENGTDVDSFLTFCRFDNSSSLIKIAESMYKTTTFDYETEEVSYKYIVNGSECDETRYNEIKTYFSDSFEVTDYPMAVCTLSHRRSPAFSPFISISSYDSFTEEDIDTLIEGYIPEVKYFKEG